MPQNGGKTIEFRKYDSLPKASTPLTEGVTPDLSLIHIFSLHGSEEALAKLRALLPGSAFAAQGRTAAKPYTEVLTAPVNEAFIIAVSYTHLDVYKRQV